MERHVYLFDYVRHPYPAVRDLLRDDPFQVLASATEDAGRRRDEVATNLEVELAGVEIGRTVKVEVVGFEEKEKPWPIAKLQVRWKAADLPAAFPSMEAQLEAYGLSERETQISFLGTYRPPLGILGGLADAALLHRVAEASLHRFFSSLLERVDEVLTSAKL